MKISIIIPIYNVENYLVRSLDSIKNQDYRNWEAILINDGSSDSSKKICEAYCNDDSRFTLINQKNQGSGAARNKGLQNAKGDYVCFVDPDDYLATNALSGIISIINNYHPNLIINGYYEISEKGIKEKKPSIIGSFDQNRFRMSIQEILKSGATAIWNKVYKLEYLNLKQIKFTSQRIGQDVVFNYHVFKEMDNVVISDMAYYVYDMTREGSAIKKYHPQKVEYETNIVMEYEKLLESWGFQKKFRKEILKNRWRIVYQGGFNLIADGSPYSMKQQVEQLRKISHSDFVNPLFKEINPSEIPSRYGILLYKLIKSDHIYLAMIAFKIYKRFFLMY